MNDRLSEALGLVINSTKDEKLKKTLQLVLQLNEDINYMDYSDWEEYVNGNELDKTMKDWFKEVEA